MPSRSSEERIIELTKIARQQLQVELKPLPGELRDFAFNCWRAAYGWISITAPHPPGMKSSPHFR